MLPYSNNNGTGLTRSQDECGTLGLVARLQQAISSEQGNGHADDILTMCLEGGTSESLPVTHPISTNQPNMGMASSSREKTESISPTTNPDAPNASQKSKRVRKRNCEQSRKNRKRARAEARSLMQPPTIKESTRSKHTSNTDPIFTPMSMANASVANGGYIALNRPKGKEVEDRERLVETLMAEGFTYKAWQGGQVVECILTFYSRLT